jgi:protein-disulfide isomerase
MPKKEATKNNNLIQLVLTVLLVGAAFAIGSMWTELKFLKGGKTAPAANEQPADAQAPQVPEEQPLTEEQLRTVLADPVYAEGDENAPVTLVEFTDYQCPFCKRHFDETAGQIETEYIKTGKVRWVIHDLPLSFHPNAHVAAEAARCAGDQDKYRQMHDKLFETQAVWSEVTDPAKTFSGYAKTLGMNTAIFDQCYTSGKYKQAVDDDLALAQSVGAGGTPTFYVNGQPLVGAQPFSAFKAAFDAALQ